MQIDFHHAATYVLARLAGFPHPEAATIAHASQYVDDATDRGPVVFGNHEPYDRVASAPTFRAREGDGFFDVPDPLLEEPNPLAWIPFHFLPGNRDLPPGPGREEDRILRLVCRADSPVAQRMNQACLAARNQPGSLHRLGITAHVYADTFAHDGFAGLCHPRNAITRPFAREDPGVPLEEPERKAPLWTRAGTPLLAALDLPYLEWTYVDGEGHAKERNNPDLFMRASLRLFSLFRCFRGHGEAGTGLGEADASLLLEAFTSFRDPDADLRHASWMSLLAGLREGKAFSFGPLEATELRSMQYWAKGLGSWKWRALGTREVREEGAVFTWTPAFDTSDWKRFHDAQKEHRAEILERILPDFGLQVRAVERRPGSRPDPMARRGWTREPLRAVSGFSGRP